ncbi:hypothetical protein RRG08_063456 [Elysia crispata]|uniref:Uncharacterized protein n=1 Tax=Elysia crispata TaxID=231223 RepID=A0AAE1DVF6_9GAST|nr:hypothetical protein RRG08_063456 [Elysia crispata]
MNAYSLKTEETKSTMIGYSSPSVSEANLMATAHHSMIWTSTSWADGMRHYKVTLKPVEAAEQKSLLPWRIIDFSNVTRKKIAKELITMLSTLKEKKSDVARAREARQKMRNLTGLLQLANRHTVYFRPVDQQTRATLQPRLITLPARSTRVTGLLLKARLVLTSDWPRRDRVVGCSSGPHGQHIVSETGGNLAAGCKLLGRNFATLP